MHGSNDPLDKAVGHLRRSHDLGAQSITEANLFCEEIALAFKRAGGTFESFTAWCRDDLGLKPAPPNAKYKVFLPIVKSLAAKTGRPVPGSKQSKLAGAVTVWLEHHPDIPAEEVAAWMGQHGGYEGVYDTKPQPPPWLKLPENAPAGQQFVVRADTPDQEKDLLYTSQTKSEAIQQLQNYCREAWNDDWGDEPADDFTVIHSYFSHEHVTWSIGVEAVAPPAPAFDDFMTMLPVAEMVFKRTVEAVETERLRAAAVGEVSPIPPLDDIQWCEPCSGTGNIVRQLPPDRRIAFDINPLDDGEFGIIHADFRAQVLDSAHAWGVVSNAPFRTMPGDKCGGAESLFAWAAAQRQVVFIGLIAPHWFQRPTIENRLDPHFHRVHREVLPADSFIRDGITRWAPAIFDVWVRRDYMREPIPILETHPDWEFLPASRRDEADAWMQYWDVGLGDIKEPQNLGRFNSPTSHWFIKEHRSGTLDRLRSINWSEVAYPTTSTPRLHKHEVITAYIAAAAGILRRHADDGVEPPEGSVVDAIDDVIPDMVEGGIVEPRGAGETRDRGAAASLSGDKTTTQATEPAGPAAGEEAEPHEVAVGDAEPVPAWLVDYENDEMEPLPDDLNNEEPFDLEEELAGLGPEPPPAEPPPKPKPVSNDTKRFANVLVQIVTGGTQGERDNAAAMLSGMPGARDFVLAFQNQIEAGLIGGDWRETLDSHMTFTERMGDALNRAYAHSAWWRERAETFERAASARYKNPAAEAKYRTILEKNLDRSHRSNSHMRDMMQKMLQNGVPRTRQDLDRLCKECHLSQAKEFRGWLDEVWSAIEREPADVPPEVVLLRARIAALTREIDQIRKEKLDLERSISPSYRLTG